MSVFDVDVERVHLTKNAYKYVIFRNCYYFFFYIKFHVKTSYNKIYPVFVSHFNERKNFFRRYFYPFCFPVYRLVAIEYALATDCNKYKFNSKAKYPSIMCALYVYSERSFSYYP